MAQQLPQPIGIKPIEIDSFSVYLRWSIPNSHGLSTEQLTKLSFEFKTTDNRLNTECVLEEPIHEYKARLSGLAADTRYRIMVRSKLRGSGDQVLTSKWSNRIEFETKPAEFVMITDDKELSMASLRHRLKGVTDENRKLKLRIEQLESELTDQSVKHDTPAHWKWDYAKITKWITRIQDGAFKVHEDKLLHNLKEEGITGKDLSMVNELNLKSWGIVNFTHRKILMRYLEKLTADDPKEDIAIEYNADIAKEIDVSSPPAPSQIAAVPEDEEVDAKAEEEERQRANDEKQADVEDAKPSSETAETLKTEEEPAKEEKKAEERQRANDEKQDDANKSKQADVEDAKPSSETAETLKTEEEPAKEEKKASEKAQEETKQAENVFDYKLSQSVEQLLESAKEKPKSWKYKDGMLSVNVIKASNVDNLDESDGAGGASDPYCELVLKGNYKAETTQIIWDNANPEWNEKFQLFVDNAKDDVLKITLYDHDRFKWDEKVGQVQIPIITILGANGYVKKEYPVVGSKTGCKLQLEMKYW
eukprot:CAMPEP_0197072930 /NCGR_PEP_ID=MMETSP1384-20130603/210344_1 /TAXON_ID=29189 /ORGANISM="Ammonia sp." /LENGTH=533 /DNA_ID=CAMNT_0042511753 /DNA_START=39 /DNA_END=1637 /DNA_ORIENTATION=+